MSMEYGSLTLLDRAPGATGGRHAPEVKVARLKTTWNDKKNAESFCFAQSQKSRLYIVIILCTSKAWLKLLPGLAAKCP